MFRRQSRGRKGRKVSLYVAGLAAGVLSAVGFRQRKRVKGATMADAKQIVRQLFEEPWKGNLGVIDKYVAPDYIGHDPSEPDPIRGPEGFRVFVEKYLIGFPDGGITVDDQIMEGDRVATRWTGRGTHMGEIAGIAPTGKQVTVSGLTISRLEGDLVIEDWTTWDTLGMLVQLGAIPAPART